MNDKKYMKIIDFFSERKNIFASIKPVFIYSNKKYIISNQLFKSENDLIEFFSQKKENFFVYQFQILNDNSIIVRYCIE
jgi:hypothetical protein